LTIVSNLGGSGGGGRRRRADAERSRAAILQAAIELLGQRPDASMEEIATAAGVARQTVYAHYSSREALLAAMVDKITSAAAAVLDAIDVHTGSAVTTLRQWLDASWSLIERYPVLLTSAMSTAEPADETDEYESHLPVMKRLAELIQRGQRTGEFDDLLPATWLIATVIAVGHAAGEEVRHGRMSAADAGTAYRESVLRVCVCSSTDPLRPSGY
jgi:AcrR family transcriptional regulator